MSEFKNHRESRVDRLIQLFEDILKGENPGELVTGYQNIIKSVIPSDVILFVDRLMMKKIPMEEMKTGINKILNLLHKTISEYTYDPPANDSYLGCMIENNRLLDIRLKKIRPLLREINANPENKETVAKLHSEFTELEKYRNYYLIKENILFPVIEKFIPEFGCLSVMWSFHEDIKRNLKLICEQLAQNERDLKVINKLAGDIFFNMYAIKFREERILYPLVQEQVPENILNALFAESILIGFPYFQPLILNELADNKTETGMINLETGNLTVEQIKLLFNHLPVDITFVDENDKVAYFSSPRKRIFPRAKSIIGRNVQNCHPPESVHVVEKIIQAFRNGTKNEASFWIGTKGEMLLIQYFAIRDENGNYKGVVEVSQEIGGIQKLGGEKRILDWED